LEVELCPGLAPVVTVVVVVVGVGVLSLTPPLEVEGKTKGRDISPAPLIINRRFFACFPFTILPPLAVLLIKLEAGPPLAEVLLAPPF